MRATIPPRGAWRCRALVCSALLLAGCQWQSGSFERDQVDDATVRQVIAPVAVPMVRHRSTPAPLELDLWAQVRADFQLDHHLEQNRVQQELRWLQRHPSYLPRLQARLQRYLPHIHAEVRARGLPGELALLPIVESALDPYAFSHGGAAGLWQFIPVTATRFGLERNWWFDARRDPVLATDAALDYLTYLHGMFGDWSLAVAGYNAGEGNVSRAVRRAGAEATFWGLRLPQETRAYVPRLLALAAMIANPEAFGVVLPELDTEPGFITVETGSQFDLARAAAVLDIDLDTLYDCNPALNQWATPPAGPHRLHVPAELGDAAAARLQAVPKTERVAWQRVKVAQGDTLIHLAQRHRTDVDTLKRINGLSGSRIRAGQALLIPSPGRATGTPMLARQVGNGNYRVKPGDSLWSIAETHGVSVASLVKTNRLGPKEVLQVGQQITVPGMTSTMTAQAGSREVTRMVRYGVRRGDSLTRIASRFNVAVRDIAQWNSLDVARLLHPGQELVIHVNVVGGE